MRVHKTTKKIIALIISLSAAALLLSILASCAQEKIKMDGPYPNTVAENAKISDEYNEFAQLLANATLWEFYDLSKIPRESGNMDRIRNYMLNWVKTYNINATLDTSGCVYIDLPPTSGHENDKNLIIQAHLDMVVNYSDDYKDFDPEKTPIEIDYDEELGQAHSKDYKTNIGADNGQGLGLCLALAKYNKDFDHGPIRLLFTYDEETTMQGSTDVPVEVLNADYLINFDCPRCGLASIGCAGDFPILISKKYATAGPTEKGASENLSINVSGLKGGHSGLDINNGRNSGSAFLIRYLNELTDSKIHFRLASIDCGDMINGIPDSFNLTLNINKKHEEEAKQIFEDLAKQLKKEFSNDNEFEYEIKTDDASGVFPSQQDTEKILEVLNYLPNGIINMSEQYKDDVETSNNIGIIRLQDGQFTCDSLYRSSDNQILIDKTKEISDNLKKFKIDCPIPMDYITPAWAPSDTSLTQMYQKAMKEVCNIDATLTSPHAGIELSIFNLKKPQMQMISIGGDVKDEHMLTETFYLKSFPVAVVPVIYIIEHINELN